MLHDFGYRGSTVYPRTRGATEWRERAALGCWGLSPHARGNRLRIAPEGAGAGSIPARAGQPAGPRRRSPLAGVYPRTRGATAGAFDDVMWPMGLSPHARGNRRRIRRCDVADGSIPARAGQPLVDSQNPHRPQVYPRTRGATSVMALKWALRSGLSPHARGNREHYDRVPPRERSIPARAGQPTCRCTDSRVRGVYPRTRGATLKRVHHASALRGLSPHARGNRRCAGRPSGARGSIPARAGQPESGGSRWAGQWVYPRTRGATQLIATTNVYIEGLSPHARGNRPFRYFAIGRSRSIPARAGQPCSRRRLWNTTAVYPRTRGATSSKLMLTLSPMGLSPHARGNPERELVALGLVGSIPARAGQPDPVPRLVEDVGVYPRTRGATGAGPHGPAPARGLSPHARGNLFHGPIVMIEPGLSPHARGNQDGGHGAQKGKRSIPARAGQPAPAA